MPSAELGGQTALVTGGGRGIGAGIARELAAAGMHVTVTGRTAEQVEAVAAEIGGRPLVGDVSRREDVDAFVRASVDDPTDPFQLARLEGDGKFPIRIKLGACRVAWFADEVEAWIAERPRARPSATLLTARKRLRTASRRSADDDDRTVGLLDEVAGGLTEHECLALVDLIRDIRRSGVSIIWIEHVVHALVAIVDRLVVLHGGGFIGAGDPTTVIRSPAVREIYMGIPADA